MPLTSLLASLCMTPSAGVFRRRESDWRIGPVVYQVFVDRFAPPSDPAKKTSAFRPPRLFKRWKELPKAGKLIPGLGLYSHELEFWGGDLESLRGKLDYVEKLGADVLYLNPIFKAATNHKYDTEDYMRIDPQLGTDHDFWQLVEDVHSRKMKIVLDGVFNHVGRSFAPFAEAYKSSASQYRDWFYFDKAYGPGYRGWSGVANLPALNLENAAVRDYLWQKSDSVVQTYIRRGIDGWRLDVAFELGPDYLDQIKAAAHRANPSSEIVGEISGYPADWFPHVDGVFNYTSMLLGEQMLSGQMSGGRAGFAMNHLVQDAGIENLLRSWLLTDNHDTARFASQVRDYPTRRLLWGLQMSLPGAPVVYYGTELGMQGGDDPENRAPMRWDLVREGNDNLTWVKKLIRIRRASPALRYGDFVALDTKDLFAFVRTTDKTLETRIVVMNPTETVVTETFPTRVGRLMSWGELKDGLTGERVRSVNGSVQLTVPPKTIRIYAPEAGEAGGYSPYHRIP